MNDYTPLRLLKENQILDKLNFSYIKRTLSTYKINNATKLTMEDFIDCIIGIKFDPKFQDVQDSIKTMFYSSFIANNTEFLNSLKEKNSSIQTEICDIVLYPVLLEKWSYAKQVFKPDEDFADALLHTDKLCITSYMIDHLPYNLFYIDVSDCEQFKPIDGIFTFIKKYDNIVSINLYSITHDLVYFSFYLSAEFDEHSCLFIDFDKFGFADYSKWDVYTPFKTVGINEKTKLTRAQVYEFAIQLIAYLSIEEPQLTESDLTKNTYRPTNQYSKIKNKWSEVHIQDVGVRYGSEFRQQMKNYIRTDSSTGDKRKSPIPHFRCAHWHKFWIGEGRTKLVVKWIAPVFVGNGTPKDTVIHRVKKGNNDT